MNEYLDTKVTTVHELERDLALRGYSQDEIRELLEFPVLLVPGRLAESAEEEPIQKLTKHQVFLAKDLQNAGILSQVVLRKDIERRYVEEREAHVDLGIIVVCLATLQQLNAFADVAQILDFLLNLIRMKFSRGRTEQLMPIVKFELDLHNGSKMVRINTEVPADRVSALLTPKRLQLYISQLEELSNDD